jgi:hypothetical protein
LRLACKTARREGVDVLLVVDWRDAGHKWSAGIKLVDVVRGEPLVNFPRLNSAELERAKRDPLAGNPLMELMRALTEYLDEQLAMQPLPEKIQPRHVARRLEVLSGSISGNPLRTLAEMWFYRERGLADDSQLLLAYQALVGPKPGGELLLGDAAAKERVLKQWLPSMENFELDDSLRSEDED